MLGRLSKDFEHGLAIDNWGEFFENIKYSALVRIADAKNFKKNNQRMGALIFGWVSDLAPFRYALMAGAGASTL